MNSALQILLKNKLILIPILLSIFILQINLAKPFIGHHDFTSAFNSMIARNYLEHGFLALKFGQVTGHIHTDLDELKSFYTHYPPLLPILIAISFKLFGIVEWAARLVPATFSVLGSVFLYLIVYKLQDLRTAILTTIFFTLNPMFIYFGNMPVAEPVIVGLSLVAVYFYLIWIEKKETIFFVLLNLTLLIGGLISWTISYLGPLLILHTLLIKKFDRRILIPTLVLFSILFLQLLHAYILTGDFLGGGVFETLISRFAGEKLSFGGQDFSYLNYIKQEISWLQAYYTRILLLLSLIFITFNLNLKFDLKKSTMLSLLFFGLCQPVIFARYTFIHDFLNIYLLPFLAVSATFGLEKLVKISKKFGINVFVNGLLITTVLTIFIFERIDFTTTLLKTEMNRPGLEMADLLNSLQTSKDQVAIVSPRFNSFYGVFTNFYTEYPYQIISEEGLIRDLDRLDYNYIITIDEDIRDEKFYNLLISKYNFKKNNNITVINLNEPI